MRSDDVLSTVAVRLSRSENNPLDVPYSLFFGLTSPGDLVVGLSVVLDVAL